MRVRLAIAVLGDALTQKERFDQIVTEAHGNRQIGIRQSSLMLVAHRRPTLYRLKVFRFQNDFSGGEKIGLAASW
jgi:hypothetical protein